MENESAREQIASFLNKYSKYSYIFYIGGFLLLIAIQLNIFNDKWISKDSLVDTVIVIISIPLGSFFADKLTMKSKKSDPYWICAKCNGKMLAPSGKWTCQDCRSEFEPSK